MKIEKKKYPEAQNPLILRFVRLMDVFTKSDDERDFYLDRIEGFLVYHNLDRSEEELELLEKELVEHHSRYLLIPKMTFYEVKRFMESFINEKVYDIDTKEKLLDILSSREPRENFLEFIYDHLTELEKWQVYYQERSRIRVIEWLRSNGLNFVFEEDLELPKETIEKVKRCLFDEKPSKDVVQARSALSARAKVYYSSEALNPRPKRGRPPKQVAKSEVEPEFALDIYTTVPQAIRPFLYIPDIVSATSVTFSAKFETEEQLLASLRGSNRVKVDERLEALSQRLESLRHMTDKLGKIDEFKEIFKSELTAESKLPEMRRVEVDAKRGKISSAIEEVLPSRAAKKEEGESEEFIPEKRKKFSIKKVTPIKVKKKSKKAE